MPEINPLCPISMTSYPAHFAICWRERCAWWDPAASRCAVLSIPLEMAIMTSVLNDLVPKEEPSA